MSELSKGMNLGAANVTTEKAEVHIPSNIQADTLFTFMKQPEYLFAIISKASISPRYCSEDVTYLHLNGIKRISFPMKCFCDINLHRLSKHLTCYGHYGIAFSKEWGMKKRIQPVQYINPDSELCIDFSYTFNEALNSSKNDSSEVNHHLRSFLLHQLMYYKPYSSPFRNRETDKMEERCFTDECEWRFIPNLQKSDFVPVYYDDQILNAGIPDMISDAMSRDSSLALSFDYSEVKHIIVKSREDFARLTSVIAALNLEQATMFELISKVIVWNEAKGDF